MNLKALQNGSDIRGVASEGIPNQHITLTDDAVFNIAAAFGLWLSDKLSKPAKLIRISIGRDSRISGEKLAEQAKKALSLLGISVYDTGLASTPAMFMSTIDEHYDFDGSIMITASHLPFNRNGMKFFTKDGGLEKSDISQIISLAENFNIENIQTGKGKIENIDFMPRYAKLLVDKVRSAAGSLRPLEGYKIIVDAGNGAGGFFAEKVLEPLGADTSGSLFLDPDGMFPNHPANPEDSKAISAACNAVINTSADLGILFDTDVDRAGAIDKNGNIFNKNRFIALISAIILEEHPGTTIVTDSTTSEGLKKFIKAHGGIHFRFKRGYRNVINQAININNSGTDCQLAMETSGHGALKENYFLDDGAYLILKILIKMAQLKNENFCLSDLIADLEEPVEAAEYRIPINCENFAEYGQSVIERITEYINSENEFTPEPENYEGIRAFNESGWFLLRLSLHDPILPLNIESDIAGGVKKISDSLIRILKDFEFLDLSCLK